MFEHRRQPLLPSRQFLIRQLISLLVAIVIIISSLMMGVFGYHFLEGMEWIDALVNASMLLGGMGPVDALHTIGGKLFALFLCPLFRNYLPGSCRCDLCSPLSPLSSSLPPGDGGFLGDESFYLLSLW